MKYEYLIEFFSLEWRSGEVSDKPGGTIYACGEAGECTIRDLRKEQVTELQDFMNDMGSKGWELVQILFNRNGAVTFWKKSAVEEETTRDELPGAVGG